MDDQATLAVEATGLVKVFGQNRAVDGVDLRVEAGTVYGVLGPNGAGKTTTISMLATLLKPDATPGKDSVRIGVRFPDGRLQVRHFAPSDSVTSLYVFVASQLIPKELPSTEDPTSPPAGFASSPGDAYHSPARRWNRGSLCRRRNRGHVDLDQSSGTDCAKCGGRRQKPGLRECPKACRHFPTASATASEATSEWWKSPTGSTSLRSTEGN